MVFVNMCGVPTLKISDPAVMQDLYTTCNSLTDKRGMAKDLLYPLFGEAILFSKNDEKWKVYRKSVAHIFYKDRLVDMMQTFKDIMANKCEEWATAAKHNKGKTVIEICYEFNEIFARNIITTVLGEDINDELLLFKVFDFDNEKQFKLK